MRKYFGTDGIRGKVGEYPITPEFVLKLGWAVGKALVQQGRGKVVIGQDGRLSGDLLSAALEAGMITSGLDVYALGILPTPGVAYLTRHLKADLGVVVSASHNPYEDNGIKFFCSEGKKLPDSIEQHIESLLEEPVGRVSSDGLGKRSLLTTAQAEYRTFCQQSFDSKKSLSGLKIVLDCAHGAVSPIAPEVFRGLGADLVVLHHEPNGTNINDQCGSMHPQALQAVVRGEQADLGIAFDGDGDRLLMVDHLGELVDGDEILFILAMHRRAHFKGGIVGTLMSNLGLEQALARLNIPFIRAEVGDRYVMDQLLANQWTLGGENSGHIIDLNHTTTGDGMIAALQVLSAVIDLKQNLHDLKQGMQKCPQILKNVRVTEPKNILNDPAIQDAIKSSEISLKDKGRLLIRPSGTEPLIRVMAEGYEQKMIESVVDALIGLIGEKAQRTR